MDVVNTIDRVELYDVELKHDIKIPDSYHKTVHVLVFLDKKANTYAWVTSSLNSFEVGKVYNIKAHLHDGNGLSYVKIIGPKLVKPGKSEQPDAEDVLLGLTSY